MSILNRDWVAPLLSSEKPGKEPESTQTDESPVAEPNEESPVGEAAEEAASVHAEPETQPQSAGHLKDSEPLRLENGLATCLYPKFAVRRAQMSLQRVSRDEQSRAELTLVQRSG